jgi:hypothetical protein
MMIGQPEWVDKDVVEHARSTQRRKRPLAALDRLRLETFHEGRCVQTLHVGSYDDEAPVLRKLHQEYLPEHGLAPSGKHHEVYLSDPRRTPPARLRTILRQPICERSFVQAGRASGNLEPAAARSSSTSRRKR